MLIHALISKAIALLEVETEIVYLSIQHPESFRQQSFSTDKSFVWTGKSVDLTEIAYSILEDINHGKVSKTSLTAYLARMFNTR